MSTQRRLIHFAHANGIPSGTYVNLFKDLRQDFDVVAIEDIGTHPQYPVTQHWTKLTDQLINSIERQNRDEAGQARPVIGLGHSLGGLLTFLAAYRRPDLFERIIMLDPPLINGMQSLLMHVSKYAAPRYIDKVTPAGLAIKRRDHWESREQAAQTLRGRSFFAAFEPESFAAYIEHGLVDAQEGGVKLAIPKAVEADIFRTGPSWLWLKPRKPPKVPIEQIIASKGIFYQRGFPQRLKRQLGVPYQVIEGSHMFPLEQSQATAQRIRDILSQPPKPWSKKD